MAIVSTRQVVITYTSPIAGSFTFAALSNGNSPGDIAVYTLAAGNNTIAFPTGGTVVQGATIIPPTGNTNSLTLKGTNADTGIVLHPTDPTCITFDTTSTTQTSIVITAGTTTTGLRIVWT